MQPKATERRRTQWAVICPKHGRIFMTWQEYNDQLAHAEDLWHCPICWHVAAWDDANYSREFHD